MKPIFLLALLCSGLVFCQTGSKSMEFSHDFYVRFLQETSELLAQAHFKKGENGQPMTFQLMPAVEFQDRSMSERRTDTFIRYQFEKTGGFESEYIFNWKNEAGATLKHRLRIDPILDFSLPEPFPRTANALLKWDGPALKTDEKLVVLCENEAGQTVSHEFSGPTDLAAVPLPASKFSPGIWLISLIKSRAEKTVDGSVTTTSLFEFYTNTKPVVVK